MGADGDSMRDASFTRGPGPLAGLRMIELGTLLAGPFAGRLLGDMGAEVIKIEPPGKPDPLRDWGQARYEGRSLWWPVQSRNKKCITLNLREPRGQELLLELVRVADVVSENFRPGTLERWNLGYDQLSAVESRHRPRAHLRVRPDRPVRRARGLRLRRRGDGRPALHQRLSRTSRRRARESRSATRSPRCSPSRASWRRSTTATCSATGAARSSTSR